MKAIVIIFLLMIAIGASGCSTAQSHNMYENKSIGPSTHYEGPADYKRTRIEIRRGSGNKIEIYPSKNSRRFRITKTNGRIIVEALD